MSALSEYHRKIDARLQELRSARAGRPVWLLEHGLDEEEIQDIQRRLQAHAASRALTELGPVSEDWLPLLVLCTETGYTYEGTGTDFWPLVAQKLSPAVGRRGLSVEERIHIRTMFERPGRDLTGVEVPDRAWSRQYNIIVWPVTHAVLPKELHRPLISAIFACREPILSGTEDRRISDLLRPWAEVHSPRLLPLLAQPALAGVIVKTMLRQESARDTLSAEILGRISEDLNRDAETRRQLRTTLRRQAALTVPRPRVQTTRTRPDAKTSRGRAALPPARARLILRHADGSRATLYLRPPRLAEPLVEHSERPAGRRQALLRLWGIGRPFPAINLINGLDTPVTCESLPGEVGAPELLPQVPSGLDQQIRLHLSRLYCGLSRPLVFAGHAEPDGTAVQLSEAEVFGSPQLWVLLDTPVDPVEGVMELSRDVCGLRVYRADARVPTARAWLASVGVRSAPQVHAELLGDPSWDRPNDYGDSGISVDDRVFLIVSGLSELPLEVRSLGVTASLKSDGLVALSGLGRSPAKIGLELRLGDQRETIDLHFVPPSPPRPLVRASLEGPSLKLDALRMGELGLRIEADAPFDGLTARLSLNGPLGGVSTRYCRLPALPARLQPGHEIWRELRESAERQDILRLPCLKLSLTIGAVYRESWPLEEEMAAIRWEESDDGLKASSDDSEYAYLRLSAAEPLLNQRLAPGVDAEVYLLVPLNGTGDPVFGAGVCVCPLGRISLGRIAPRRPPRLLRRLRPPSATDGDLWTVASSWLAWATARARELAAEVARGRVAACLEAWVTEILCGVGWVETEARIDAEEPEELHVEFARTLRSRGLATDALSESALVRVLPAARVEEILRREMERALAEQDGLLRSLLDLAAQRSRNLGEAESESPEEVDSERARRERLRDASDAELKAEIHALEDLLNMVYPAVKAAVEEEAARPADGYEEPDLSLDETKVERAVRGIDDRRRGCLELRPLLERLVPASERVALAEYDYNECDDDEIISHLASWEKEHHQALSAAGPGRAVRWERQRIEALYDLWQRPRRAVAAEDWRDALTWAIGGRFTCQAVRYAVLRRRAALRRGRDL